MRKSVPVFLQTAILICLTSHQNGCTLIGFTIGSIKDASKPDRIVVETNEVETLRPGATVQVLLDDGTSCQGKLLGLWARPQEDYSENYLRFLASSQCRAKLPHLEMVTIRDRRTGNEFNVKFIGFDYGCAMLMDTTKQTLAKAPYYGFLEIVFDGDHVVTLDSLWSTVRQERVPLFSAVVVEEARGVRILPLNEIKEIHVPVKKNGKIIGLLVGGAMDAAVIIVATSIEPLVEIDWTSME